MISALTALATVRAAMVAADFNFASCGAVTALPAFLTGLNATYTRASVQNVLQGTTLTQLAANQFGTNRDGVPVAYSEKNKLLFTEEFDKTYHTKNNLTVTANAVNDSQGNLTADKLCESTTSNVAHYWQAASSGVMHLGVGVLQTFSIEVCAAERTQCYIQLGSFGCNFNLSTGTIISGTGGAITSLGGGWYRCSMTAAPSNNNLFFGTLLSGAASYAGTVGYGLYVSRAQLEFGNLTAYERNYDGVTGKYGALIEPAATNLLTYSEDFSNAAWTKTNCSVTSNAAVAPDGNTTADKLVPDTSLNQHRVNQTSASTAAVHTFSIFLKAAGYNYAFIRLGYIGAYVDLTGTNAPQAIGAASNLVSTHYGNGWYRCSFSCTAAVNDIARVNAVDVWRGGDFSGDGTSGIYTWGAQLETGNIATSYIATTGSTATRAVGKLVVPLWKNNLAYSTDPTGTGWNRSNVTLTGGQSDSSGGTTAYKVEVTTTATTVLSQNTIKAPAGVLTYSIKVKAGSGPTTLSFILRNSTTATDFTQGVFITATGAISGSGWTSTADGNGYYKLTFTQSSGISVGDALIFYVGYAGSSRTAGHYFYYDSPQLEPGSTATTYIPTTSTLDVTGNANIPGFSSAGYSLAADFRSAAARTSSAGLMEINDNSSTNRSNLAVSGSDLFNPNSVTGGSSQMSIAGSACTNLRRKGAASFQANNFLAANNGVALTADTSGTMPTGLLLLNLGSLNTGSNAFNGNLFRLQLLPRTLTQAQLNGWTMG